MSKLHFSQGKSLFLITFLLLSTGVTAQNIDYTAWIYQFSSWETSCNWETGTEEYTRNGYIEDNQYYTETSATCQQCNNNGDCHSTGTWASQTRTSSTATQVRVRIDAWEDDSTPRCSYNGGDDCRTTGSNWTTMNNPVEYQTTTVDWNTGDSDHRAYARCQYIYTSTTLENAVDNSSFSFTTGGDRPFWGAEGSWSNVGNDCAASGTITDNETSSFSVTVSCVSQVSFQWKVSSENSYDFLKFYINGVQQNAISGVTAWTTMTYALDPNIDNTLEWRYTKDGSVSSNEDRGFVDQVNYTSYSIPAAGTSFASNSWNVAGYNGRSLNLSGVTYRGYYVENNLNINTTSHWTSGDTPSNAASYDGCSVGVDNHTTVHKRQGFPCGEYRIDIADNEDEIRIYIDGAQVYEFIGCCTAHPGVWTGYLGTTSTVEIRTADGGGGYSTQVNFVDVTPALSGGTIGGAQTICNGASPTGLTNNVGPTGPGTLSYQWQESADNVVWSDVAGATAPTLSPGAMTASKYYRRRTADQCGSTFYSNVIQVNVLAPNAPPSVTPVAGTVCPNTNTTLSASGGSAGTGTVLEWYTGAGGSGTHLGTGTTPAVAPMATTTYYVRAEGTCGQTTDASVTINVKDFIYAPTGTTVSNNFCTDNDGWHHFYDGNEVILSLKGDLSGAAPGYPQVTINKSGSFFQERELPGALNCGSGVANGEERFEMSRSWNVDFGGGTYAGTYDVRYYFEAAEKTEIENAAAAFIAANPDCGYTYKYANPNGFFWFKNTGSNYSGQGFDGLHLTGAGSSVNSVNLTEINGITSFSGGSGGIILVPDPGLGALAVEFVTLEGWVNGEVNELAWQTASLINSEKFVVERYSKVNEKFAAIGEVKSGGNSTSLQTFYFTDENPMNGENIYRIKEVDFNGTLTYSDVVTVVQENGSYHSIYPNPTEGVLVFECDGNSNEEFMVSITDVFGKIVLSKRVGVTKGLSKQEFDLSNFAAGTYFFMVRSQSGDIQFIEKLVVK